MHKSHLGARSIAMAAACGLVLAACGTVSGSVAASPAVSPAPAQTATAVPTATSAPTAAVTPTAAPTTAPVASVTVAATASASPAPTPATAIPVAATPAATPSAPLAAPTQAPATPAPTPTPAPAIQGTVAVTLIDSAVKLDRASSSGGTLRFDIKNAGSVAHELVFLRTDVAQDRIPQDATKPGYVSEPGYVTQTGTLAPGASTSLTLTLATGAYVLLCNQPAHYLVGMHTGFTVN